MHFLNVVTALSLLMMVGSELSVSTFVDPNAWRLEPPPQSIFLSRYAAVLGKVMPFWYGASLVLLIAETWLSRHTPELPFLGAAALLWFVATLGSILFLVPLNNRVAAIAPDWQLAHHRWDSLHRIRIAILFVAALLFIAVIAR